MKEETVKNIKTPEDLVYLSSGTTAEKTATTPQTPQISTPSLPRTPQAQRFASIEPMSPDTEESFSPSPYNRRSTSKDLENYHSGEENETHESSEDELALGKGGVSATYVADSGTPNSFKEARNSDSWPYWKQAITEELSKMDKYQVFKIVPRIPGQHILKGRWVFTRKIDGNTGKVAAFKARWVAKGYAQIEGIHFNDIHASVVHKDSIRVLLALVNHLDYECDQLDIKAAFLNGELEETIFMEPPEGSDIKRNSVIQLCKSLYGLKQSPRCFNKAFDSWMKTQGFQPSRADPCLYVFKKAGVTLLLSVHVDDQLVASNSRIALDKFKNDLNARFECTDNGPVNYFLGFNVSRDRKARKLYISQEFYVDALLDKFDIVQCNPVKTPFPPGYKPLAATDREVLEAKQLDYPKIAGSVLYLSTITRPDIAYAAGVLARYISRWSLAHFKAAKHLLRYLRGTSDLCLTFNANAGSRILLGFADADWGGCQDTRRSTSGYVFKTFGGVTSWRARRQPTVSLSTAEAEYLASADAAKQAIWLRTLLEDLGYPQQEATTIYNDNMGAILLSKNPVHHDRSKHISLRHHFLRDQVNDNIISLIHVPSKGNEADLLTKSLSSDLYEGLRKDLGMAHRSLGNEE